MTNNIKVIGLKPLPKDRRDLKLGAIVKLPELSELPDEFDLGELPLKDQSQSPAGSDLCSAYASCLISEFQEDVELCPEWSFAASKEITGDDDVWGQDMRSAMKVHQKYGAVEKNWVEIPQNPRVLASWNPELKEKAKQHKKEAYVNVLGQYDYFDDIRASIYYFRNEKRAVSLGLIWNWDLNDIILQKPSNEGFGHMVAVIGWGKINNEMYLKIQNSYGNVGENGRHYVSREVVNTWANRYGAMMFIDVSPDELKQQQWSILAKIVDLIKKTLELMLQQTKKIEEEKIIESINDDVPPVKVSRIIDLAKAIMEYENSPKSWNNPGAIKNKSGQFLKFPTYQEGFDYLCDYLRRACLGQHKAYKPEMTIMDFFHIYAPDYDKNDSAKYALTVAKKLDVPIDIKIKDLL